MKTEIQWYIASDTQGSGNQGDFDTREQAEQQAKLRGYSYVERRTLEIDDRDEIVDVQSKYFWAQ